MEDKKIILETINLSRNFGALKAVNEVNLKIYEGESHAIIGPNGAGKSTLMDLIINRTKPSSGQVIYRGQDITNKKPTDIVNMGILKSFQISKLFSNLTCFENVRIALIKRFGKSYDFLPKKTNYLREESFNVLKLVGMENNIDEIAGLLSYGDQRRLEIAITLAMDPILLMLDEPTAGVARAEGYQIMEMINNLAKEKNFTVVFIEHDMDIVFNYADRISVLGQGKLLLSDTPQKVHEDAYVQQAYFGGGVV